MRLTKYRCSQPGCTRRRGFLTFGGLMRHVHRCPHNVIRFANWYVETHADPSTGKEQD